MKIFSQLKRHYEKVLLAFALVALIGAIVYLNMKKSDENAKIAIYEEGVKKPKVKPFPTVDMNVLQDAMRHATNPPALNFSPPHNVFNPVKWQKRVSDGTRIKAETGKELGVNALVLAKLSALSTIISLDGPSGSGANMSITQEASTNAYYRQKLRSFISTNATDKLHRASRAFTLHDLRLTADGAEADIEMTDGARMTVATGKPFNRIEAYKADLHYPPENQSFKDRRVGDALTVAGEDYIIVAITANEVVVSARSNDRRTTIRNNTAP